MSEAIEGKVGFEKFMEVWEAATSAKEVAEKLNLKLTSVQARASKYRADGLPLKNMSTGGKGGKIDMAAARAKLAALRGVDVTVVDAAAEKIAEARKARAAVVVGTVEAPVETETAPE